MKVIGAGMPRTGTLTQKMSLEMLGLGPCYHMVNVMADLEQAAMWQEALAGKAPWSRLFAGFQSTVDWPGGYFYRELADFYPEAKVVLSERHPDSWERSMRETVWAVRNGESMIRLLSSAQAQVNPAWHGFLDMVDQLLWANAGTFAGVHEQSDSMIARMKRHSEEVRADIPAERLLVWSVAEGWEPLCEFLEVPIPDVDFPHINDRAEFSNRIVDRSLQVIQEWRSGQIAVEPVVAVES